MTTSRVIRVDKEVWAELQRRAIPFEDNPNSVLRREFGIPAVSTTRVPASGENMMDERVLEFMALIEKDVGQLPLLLAKKQSFRFNGENNKVRAYVYDQKRQLKIETAEGFARAVGIESWDHWRENGWFGYDNSVYWDVTNGNQDTYRRVANIMAKLWRL